MADQACPHCGGQLKLKEVGNRKFYGCSNFPKCKATFPPDEEGGADLDKSSFKAKIFSRRTTHKTQIER